MLTVACTLRSGGLYTPEWAYRLERAVAENLSTPHRFVCLSDLDLPGMERIALRHDWPGWWSKIEMLRLDGPVLCLDLDLAIVGPLEPLLAWPAEAFDGRSFGVSQGLKAFRDFYRPRQFNSSVMLVEGRQDLYARFAADAQEIMGKWRGDQEWLSDIAPEAMVWDRPPIVSFRKDCRTKLGMTLPPKEGVAVVVFHGQPKMPAAEGWPRDYWLSKET